MNALIPPEPLEEEQTIRFNKQYNIRTNEKCRKFGSKINSLNWADVRSCFVLSQIIPHSEKVFVKHLIDCSLLRAANC